LSIGQRKRAGTNLLVEVTLDFVLFTCAREYIPRFRLEVGFALRATA